MSSPSSEQLDAVFHALADPTRRAILEALTNGAGTVTEIAKPFDMSLPGVSKHIRVLEKAGLIDREVDGRTHRCRLEHTPLMNAREWIDFYSTFWNDKLDRLERYANDQSKGR